jgi:replicative DNA helicase
MPGAVYVLAARPGGGKSMCALNMAVDLAKRGPVAFVSFEMMQPEIWRRLIAAEAEVSLTKLNRNRLEPADWDRVRDARARIMDMPLFIDDRMGSSMTQVEAYVRQVARKGKLAGVVVDYLQLIPSTDPRKSRWEHIGDLTRQFKQLAGKLGVPVILLSQLNRESEKIDRLPTLSDLRESGSIEQDADVVLFLARRKDKLGQFEDVVDLIVAKNRHGAMGRLELDWEGKFARLSNRRFGDPEADWKARQAGE